MIAAAFKLWTTWLVLTFCVTCSQPVLAHEVTFAMYSKYEATTSGRDIAFVFALEKNATLQLIQDNVTQAAIEPEALRNYSEYFSTYFFERLSVSNNGVACIHPPLLDHFAWDQATSRVLAVTKFSCESELDEVVIRSSVTHDMTVPHATMGDLQHGLALVRHSFAGDNTEARETLHLLPQTHATYPAPIKRRGKFSYVAVPDTKRRYEAWTREVLGRDFVRPQPEQKPALPVVAEFLSQGIWHILAGYDHVLFVITLLMAVQTWRHLAWVVTSFTAAHSLTLVGATLGLVSIAPPVVEPAIALTVLFVAVDGLLRPHATARPALTFAFGLLHGFGLSDVLLKLGWSGSDVMPALLGFNLGVECGQLLIVAPLFPLVVWLQKRRPAIYRRVRIFIGIAVALLAVSWFVARVQEAIAA